MRRPASMKNDSQLRILLVESDSSARGALNDYLLARGYDVTPRQSGTLAMRDIRENPEVFDLVITDMDLADAGPLEILNVARQRSTATQVVTMPSFAALDIALEAMRQGAFDYVIKPFKFTQFEVMLNKVVERRKLVSDYEKLVERVQSLYGRLDLLKDNRDRLDRFVRDLFDKVDYQTEMLEECVSILRKLNR
jgi:DNA-binding NtrC family response regulator